MDDLIRLLGTYRESLPDPDPGPDFMPGLWRKIERHRSPERMLRRFAEAFALLAAATALLVGAILVPRLQMAPIHSASYVEVLENESGEMAYAMPAQSPHEVPPVR